MIIFVIGSHEEAHSKWIYDNLKARNIDVEYFDSRLYPENLMINWSPENPDKMGYLIVNNRKINIKDVKGFYWRWFYGVNYKVIEDGENTQFLSNMVYRERQSLLNSLFASMDRCNWLNSYKAIELHKNKAHQTNILAKNGIRVPKTLITNDGEGLREFYEDNNKKVIYKPVLGGAYTKVLSDDDFLEENLEALKISPVQFQEFVEGIDVRVYAMGDKIFAAEMLADTLDFREDKQAKLNPIELPQKIQDDCKKILNLLDLTYSGIDVRRTPEGEYVFIEANPAPMFIYYEKMTGYPITETLVEMLLK